MPRPTLPAGTYHPVNTPESKRKVAAILAEMNGKAGAAAARIRKERIDAENAVYARRMLRALRVRLVG